MKLRKDYESIFFVCPHGIGDTIFLASLVKEYKRCHGVHRVVLIVKKSHGDLPDMFDAVDGKIVSDRIVKQMTLYARRHRIIAQDNWRFGHFILEFGWPEPGQLLGVRGINLLDIYRACVLNIAPGTSLQCPEAYVPQDMMKQLEQEYATNRKTVLLMPYAATVHRLPQTFWETLAQRYLQRGYRVYTNVKGEDEAPIRGTKPLSPSLKDLFIITRTFGWECVSLRSGICDLLGFSDVHLTVLYENIALLAGWNMVGLNLPNPNIRDVLLPPDLSGGEQLERVFEVIMGT